MLFSISCFLAAAWLPALVSTTYCNVGTLHLTPCLLWYMFLYKLFFETLSGSLGFHIVLKNTAVFFLCNPYTEVSCTYCHYCSWCQKYEILLFLCRIWLYGSGDLHCCVADSAIICIYSYTPTLHNSYNGCLVMAKDQQGNTQTRKHPFTSVCLTSFWFSWVCHVDLYKLQCIFFWINRVFTVEC